MTGKCFIVRIAKLCDATHFEFNDSRACRVTATIGSHADGVESQKCVIIRLQQNRPGHSCLWLEANVHTNNLILLLEREHKRSAFQVPKPSTGDVSQPTYKSVRSCPPCIVTKRACPVALALQPASFLRPAASPHCTEVPVDRSSPTPYEAEGAAELEALFDQTCC